jgi:outer membrane protein TolC
LTAQITLSDAVRRAGATYPGVQAPLEEVKAAAAGVQLARTQFLPKGEFLAQVNRATRNNVYGMLLPQSTLPAISGPPLAANAGTSVWGTATGFLISWEPFDFGLRDARVRAAEAGQARSEAAAARRRFDVETATADAFLTVLAAQRTVEAAQAGLERARQVEKVVAALAQAGLRPGADLARAQSERALAEAQLIQAEQSVRAAQATLRQFAGETAVVPGPLLKEPPVAAMAAAAAHPLLREQQASAAEVEARHKSLDLAWRPRFLTQSALYARGTGANPDFTTGGAVSGLGPNIYNWGVGFTVLFPFLDFPQIKSQKDAESSRLAAEQARARTIERELAAATERAQSQADAARRIARLVPEQVSAARAAFAQAQARYQSGLAPVVELADAQRLLTLAESDSTLAQLNVWRGLLAVAVAQGDLAPFLELAGRP